jgi:uncharacterized protein (TIGR03435 family)
MRHTIASLLAVLLIAEAHARQKNPSFEVASIKRSAPDAAGTSWGTQPGGRWAMRNMAVSVMIREAYPTPARDLVGAPAWVTSERYDVNAKADGNPTRDEIRLMLRTMLAERFKLAVHQDTREQPVYALVIARSDGRTRPGLVRSTTDCDAVTAARREGRTVDAPAPANGISPCSWNASFGPDGVVVRFAGLPLSRLAESVGQPDGRVVIDRSGLPGGYEFTLTYSENPTPGDGKATLFTALEEQLGLKLIPDRVPLTTLVVDQIERPTPD